MQNELDNWLNKYDDFMETQNGKIAEIQVRMIISVTIYGFWRQSVTDRMWHQH